MLDAKALLEEVKRARDLRDLALRTANEEKAQALQRMSDEIFDRVKAVLPKQQLPSDRPPSQVVPDVCISAALEE